MQNTENFPYPILNDKAEYKDYNIENGFIFTFIMQNNDNGFIDIDVKEFEINVPELKELIETRKAECFVFVECAKTGIRRMFEADKEITIKSQQLIDLVEVTGLVIANENISNYKSELFSSDFKQNGKFLTFNIDKYDFLAVNNNKVRIDKEDYLGNLESVFIINKNPDVEAKTLKVTFDNKINVFIPQKEYDIFYNLNKDMRFSNIFFSMFAFPALLAALVEIRDNRSEVMDDSWCKSIEKKMKDLKKSIDADVENKTVGELTELAQSIFDYPLEKSMNCLENLYNVSAEGE